MPAPKNKYDEEHKRNIVRYEARIDSIYKTAVNEMAIIGHSVGEISDDKPFRFEHYPRTHKRVQRLLSDLRKSVEMVVVNGIKSEWELSTNKNDELARRAIGERIGRLSPEQINRYFNNHEEAREAFLIRKDGGLDLSQKVWNYTEQFKQEMELALDIGLGDGRSADALSRDLRQYLKHPDKLFRRVRDKHGQLHLSKAAKAYHPGRGVYRSSYKNARRLAATETNMAYRTADHLRWQDMDFVLGIEINLSNNHTLNGVPFTDICDDLKGKYPKDFKFVGWHPLCRCFATPALKTEAEMDADFDRILQGEEPNDSGANEVKDTPRGYKDWLKNNEERIKRAEERGKLPYFLRDNEKYYKTKPTALKIAENTFKTKEVRIRAKALTEKTYITPQLNKEIKISNKAIKEWTNQPHIHFVEKNKSLLKIEEILKNAQYIGFLPDKHQDGVLAHVLETHSINNEASWIILREFPKAKELHLHSITDSEKLKRLINNKNKLDR